MRNSVPVYSVNSQSKSEKPLRYVTEAQARELLADGKARRVSGKKEKLQVQLVAPAREERDSPTTISFREMMANAGVVGTRPEQLAAQAKVAEFAVRSWADRVVMA